MDGRVSGEDIISPMQIAFGLRPAEYTLGLAAPVRPCRIFQGGAGGFPCADALKEFHQRSVPRYAVVRHSHPADGPSRGV